MATKAVDLVFAQLANATSKSAALPATTQAALRAHLTGLAPGPLKAELLELVLLARELGQRGLPEVRRALYHIGNDVARAHSLAPPHSSISGTRQLHRS